MRRDSNGIPILDASEIEQLAERFLTHVAPDVLAEPTFTPLAEIMALLQDEGRVTFAIGVDLGWTPQGHKYLGCYDPVKGVVLIDSSLTHDDPRFPFTVAHELGHFYLHGKVRLAAVGVPPGESGILDSSRDIVIHRVDMTRPRTMIEWQANRFAAAILIPRATVIAAIQQAQNEMGINRNVGTVVLDAQPYSRRDFQETIGDRKSTRLNSSHGYISYAVFCLKKKKTPTTDISHQTRPCHFMLRYEIGRHAHIGIRCNEQDVDSMRHSAYDSLVRSS